MLDFLPFPQASVFILDRLASIPVRKLLLLALAAPFLISGIMKAIHLDEAQAEIRTLTGLDANSVVLVIALAVIVTQLGGALLLLSGQMATILGAFLLAGFTAIATLLAHKFWSAPDGPFGRDFMTFFEHLALVGGLLLAAHLEAREIHT